MSRRLYVIFKPEHDLSEEEAVERINDRFPNAASITDDFISIAGKWAAFLTLLDYYINPCASFCFWSYWDAVLENMDFRSYVMELCEALGTDEWWYIEETSTDLYDELSYTEYEKILANAIGIENFEMPTYFPNSKHHFFKDSSSRVKSLQSKQFPL